MKNKNLMIIAENRIKSNVDYARENNDKIGYFTKTSKETTSIGNRMTMRTELWNAVYHQVPATQFISSYIVKKNKVLVAVIRTHLILDGLSKSTLADHESKVAKILKKYCVDVKEDES